MNIATPASCYTAALPTVDEALAILAAHFGPAKGSENLPLHHAIGRIAAADVHAAIAMPPWDRSAMDGFAFRSGAASPMRLIGRATAGQPFADAVPEGACVAISTGAKVPAGCDSVAMREYCRVAGTTMRRTAETRPGANIRRRGEDFQEGDKLLAAGTRLDARHIALLASAGMTELAVRRRLRIAILSIGDELAAGPIFDANRPMLKALCAGAEISDLGILPDQRQPIGAALAKAAASHDIIISSAGTSVGDEDHVHDALLDCGGEMLVAGVAIKPGKPVSFGKIGGCLTIALPGNPAAALITFLALGAPLLRHLRGETLPAARRRVVRAAFSHRKKPGLREYLRVILNEGLDGVTEARTGGKNGSAMLLSLAHSDGLVCLDENLTDITPGMMLHYQSFSEMAP